MTPPDIDRLQALETAESARNLVNQYCTALDNQDLSLLASLFAEDIALDRAPDPPLHGREAALDFFAGAFEHSVDRRKHFNTNTNRQQQAQRQRQQLFFCLSLPRGKSLPRLGKLPFWYQGIRRRSGDH